MEWEKNILNFGDGVRFGLGSFLYMRISGMVMMDEMNGWTNGQQRNRIAMDWDGWVHDLANRGSWCFLHVSLMDFSSYFFSFLSYHWV